MKINSVEKKRCQLYMKQEKQINKYYSEKKKNFKHYIEEQYLEFVNKLSNFKIFCFSVNQYNETIKTNVENYKKLVSNFNPIIKSSIPILMELRRVLTLQQDAEKEKYERLNLSNDFDKLVTDYENKGKNILNSLGEKCDEYINIIDKLNLSHLAYLRNFYVFEMKMINDETKTTKETEEENLVSSHPKEDTFLVSLHNKENQYKTNLDNVNKEIKIIYGIINKYNDELNNIYKEMNDIMGKYLNNIHLGYVSSIKMQQIFEEKFLQKNSNNSDEKNNNKKELHKSNNANINDEGNKNSRLEKIGQEIQFESYNLLSPYANITGYKLQNKILDKLKPEIIYKISCIINSEFNYISKVDLKEQYRIMDVKLICQRIVDSTEINKKEEEQFYEYLEERKYRLAFLAALNSIRSAGKCLIKKKSLMILGNAYKIIVDKLTKENNENNIDYDILKYLIIMSQTYYALGINGKDKIYLIRFIEDSPYFKSEKLWNTYISQEIEQELEKQNSWNMWNLETDENEEYRLNQIYFGKFISFTQNLIVFRYDKKFIYDIIHNLIDAKYKITQDFIKQIDALIENSVYDKVKKFEPEKDILE